MQIQSLLQPLRNCPCGRAHTVGVQCAQIGRGILPQTASILRANGFPKKILVVAGAHSLAAADGIPDVLRRGGFDIRLRVYSGVHASRQSDVNALLSLCAEADGLLFVGAGALGDICRRVCFLANKAFAVFATAPSTDGFVSDTAPVTDHHFKRSLPAREPSVLLADADILAAAPSINDGRETAKCLRISEWTRTS